MGMDAVLFAAKRAHLGCERFGTRMLRGFGLTPARFDLMNVVSGFGGVKQSDIWRRLGVVRSAVCEMLVRLQAIGLVQRRRDTQDRRTWVVSLTARGREVFERAYEALINSGDVAVCLDSVLARRNIDVDTAARRYEYVGWLLGLGADFGARARGPDLYWWDYEDFYAWFADVEDGDPEGGVPFVKAS